MLAQVAVGDWPSDIVMSGSTAIIAIGGGKAKLVDLTNPAQPQIAGEISGVGTRLALTESSLLVSTDRTYLTNTIPDALRGLHVAAFDPIAAVGTRATISKVVESQLRAPQAEQEEETLEDSPLRLNVFPATYPVTEALLQLFKNGVTLGNPVSVAMAGGRGLYNLAKGFRKKPSDKITAVMTYQADGKEVKNLPKEVPIGTITIRVDSNNDTIVAEEGTTDDQKDETAVVEGKSFGFWEADTNAQGENVLVDYATFSLRARITLRPEHRVALRFKDRTWDVRVKGTAFGQPLPADCPKEKAYLCDSKTAEVQTEIIERNGPAFWEGWLRRLPMLLLPPELPRPIQRLGGVIELPQDLLSTPFRTVVTPQGLGRSYISETPFLFKAQGRTTTQPPPPQEVLEVGWINDAGDFVRLNEAKVEVKPFKKLTGMFSARQVGEPGDASSGHYKVSSSLRVEPDWAAMPEQVKRLTVLVHGFRVPDAEFKGEGTVGWFGGWAKRLYWAGHKILAKQDDSWAVGLSWPGDIPGPINSALYFPEDEFTALQAGLPLGRELASWRGRTGMERVNIFAHSLGNMVVHNALKEVPSSGAAVNYVMNDAAIASEAFLAAYNPTASALLVVPGVQDLLDHARKLGYPDPGNNHPDSDWVWLAQEATVEGERVIGCPQVEPYPYSSTSDYCRAFYNSHVTPPHPQCLCDHATPYYRQRPLVNPALEPLAGADPVHAQTPFFTTRWSGLPRNQDNSVPGAWTRFFVGNLTRPEDLRIFNTYNSTDSVLRLDTRMYIGNLLKFPSWKACQLSGKPFGPVYLSSTLATLLVGGAEATDPAEDQRWWTLAIAGRPSAWRSTAEAAAEQNGLWAGLSPQGNASTDERTRQWAELALWYPALSAAAGATSLENLNTLPLGNVELPQGVSATGRNVDFTRVGGDGGQSSAGSLSHSYMQILKYHEVWKAYRVMRGIFAQ